MLWSLLRKYVTTPDTAKPAKWAAALASLTKEDLDEYHCAQREFSPTRVTLPGFPGLAVAPRAVLAAAVAVQGVGFLNCVHALKDNGYTVFTGQHQVQSRDNTRSVVETLLRGSYLAELTATLRTIRPTDKKLCMEQCCKALKITHVGEFLQYQIIQDLVEPRNSIFRGQPNESTSAASCSSMRSSAWQPRRRRPRRRGQQEDLQRRKGQAGARHARALVVYGKARGLGEEERGDAVALPAARQGDGGQPLRRRRRRRLGHAGRRERALRHPRQGDAGGRRRVGDEVQGQEQAGPITPAAQPCCALSTPSCTGGENLD